MLRQYENRATLDNPAKFAKNPTVSVNGEEYVHTEDRISEYAIG